MKGYMILPTNTYRDEEVEDESSYFQILSDLHLCGANTYSAAKIVYLPSPSLGPQTSEPKLGPIQEAISEWLETLPEFSLWKTGTARSDLLENPPKRWSIYEPMLLLPSGSFQSPIWTSLLQSPAETHLPALWNGILQAVRTKEGGPSLTHLAINSGIPLNQDSPSTTKDTEGQENILRSPSGLVLLHGDFGPLVQTSPTEADFRHAFWVSTKQNGIVQTWAPRYTMFSRGNIKEKSRLLEFHDPGVALTSATKRVGREERTEATAIDLYAGIGYFVFSYAAAGFGKVLCWEINPWSVEGLRRGCRKNGWGCGVLRGGELERPLGDVLLDDVNLVVFEESNERAAGRMEAIREWERIKGQRVLGDVLHVNCGFLPSSEASWRVAWKILCKSRSAWLHLHENVGVDDVGSRRKGIEGIIGKWAMEEGTSQIVEVEHVELVKTFAPGVWHCVFDVHVQPALADGS
jgi:tRNA wybutosine-synthesizing protein 2